MSNRFSYYPPYGSAIPGLQYTYADDGDTSMYRFGFNNQEQDSELGDYYAFEYRMHDARLGRFLSVDPLKDKYPWNSTYSYSENRVISCRDFEGLESINSTRYQTSNNGNVLVLMVANRNQVPLQFTRTAININGAVSNNGVISAASPGDFCQEQEFILLGKGKGQTVRNWGTSTTPNGMGFVSSNGSGPIIYNTYRPIIWKSSNDGVRNNDNINANNQVVDKAFGGMGILTGNMPMNVRVGQEIALINATLNVIIGGVEAVLPRNTPIRVPFIPPATDGVFNIANFPHPDFPASNITITQNIQTVANQINTNIGNWTITLSGNLADQIEMNQVAAGLQGLRGDGNMVNVNVVINPGIPAGWFDFSIQHTINTTIRNSRTTTTTTATDGQTGQNIPQGN